jgi:DNA-binding NarL/FixJ family response regulator
MDEPLVRYLHAEAARTDARDGLHVIHGAPAVFARLKQVAAVTGSEVLSLEPRLRAQALSPEHEAREGDSVALALARRGVRQLSVMSDWLEARPDSPTIQELASAGSPTRYSPSLPMRVLVADRRVAFFALDARDTRRGAYMTTASTLVQLVCRLFDEVWQRSLAVPGLATANRSDETAAQQRQRVLDLLSDGHSDDRIARDMGVSTRTIGRAVAQLQAELGAHSRFQLALLAQQAGLLAHRPTQPRRGLIDSRHQAALAD